MVVIFQGHCHGLQACQALADASSFGEPCPGLGSYLSVEYHCKDGMRSLYLLFDCYDYQSHLLYMPMWMHKRAGNDNSKTGDCKNHAIRSVFRITQPLSITNVLLSHMVLL